MSYMKALFCSLTHTKTYFEENISRGVFHRVFWGCRGVWGGYVWPKRQQKWPPIGEKLQITQKSNVKALFCSCIHNKTYFEENISRGIFHTVFWGCLGCRRGMCDQKILEYLMEGLHQPILFYLFPGIVFQPHITTDDTLRNLRQA